MKTHGQIEKRDYFMTEMNLHCSLYYILLTVHSYIPEIPAIANKPLRTWFHQLCYTWNNLH